MKTTNMKKHSLSLGSAFALALATPAFAALTINESFDYGGVSDNLANVSSWTSGSTFNDYIHDGGLNSSAINGETGGTWFADRPGGNLTAGVTTSTLVLSGIAPGDGIWAMALFDYRTGGTSNHTLIFEGGSVTELGFTITAAGDVNVLAALGAGASTNHDTGIDVTIDGTYVMLMQAIQGTGTSPTNSTVNFWFDPTDTSSIGALGVADWSTGATSKWGRHTQDMSGITGLLSAAGSTDEIRLGTDFAEVIGAAPVPEPSTALLGGLGLFSILLRRRR